MSEKAKRGFGAMDPEKAAAMRAKSLETRRRNKEAKEGKAEEARKKRAEADALIKKAEQLRQEADELDGQNSSEKARKAHEKKLNDQIDAAFRDSVSPQYLKIMKRHAIMRNLSVDQLVSPTMAAMDILHDPKTDTKQRNEAMKLLQSFENSKPAAPKEEEGGQVGSIQEEMDALMTKLADSAPKR